MPKFEFILDRGDAMLTRGHVPRKAGYVSPSTLPSELGLNAEAPRGNYPNDEQKLRVESTKLIKYFLASLTIPEQDLWVNLSPYEKNRIIPKSFGLTEMGRDLLAEDYMLKQITASLMYPEGKTGKRFWKRIYEEAVQKFGTTNIPVNTFNKVWIVPEKAVVYENVKAGAAYVVEATLKVMLEEDYLSLSKHAVGTDLVSIRSNRDRTDTRSVPKDILKEIIIPELDREVNEGQNFAQLRQVYNSLILATWYKKKIKDSILEEVYADKNKIVGLWPSRGHGFSRVPMQAANQGSNEGVSDPEERTNDVEHIYQRYLQAFKKGAYNYIKEEQDPMTQQIIPRKYFSGGVALTQDDWAMTSINILPSDEMHHPVVLEVNLRAIENQDNAQSSRILDPAKLKDLAFFDYERRQRAVRNEV